MEKKHVAFHHDVLLAVGFFVVALYKMEEISFNS